MENDLKQLKYTIFLIERAQRLNKHIKNEQEYMSQDEQFRDGLVLSVMNIGEYAHRLSDEFKEKHPEVSWKGLKEQRNFIAHDYANINYRTVWRTFKNNISVVKEQLIEALEKDYGLNYQDVKKEYNLPKVKKVSMSRGR